MAAADCAKSQDSSTDTVMPVEMQGLKEVLDKASKKPLIKEDTWYLVDSRWYKQLKKYLGLDGSSDSMGKKFSKYIGIFFPKLLCPTVRKKCFSD